METVDSTWFEQEKKFWDQRKKEISVKIETAIVLVEDTMAQASTISQTHLKAVVVEIIGRLDELKNLMDENIKKVSGMTPEQKLMFPVPREIVSRAIYMNTVSEQFLARFCPGQK